MSPLPLPPVPKAASVLRLLLLAAAVAAVLAAGLPDRHEFVDGPVPVTRSAVSTWASTYASIYQAWPRFAADGKPAPKLSAATLNVTVSLASGGNAGKAAGDSYLAGVTSVSAVMIIIGVVSLLLSVVFCFCRFCCNCCGRRRRTRKYSAGVVWTMRALMLLYLLVLIGVALIGYNGVVGGTFAFDSFHQVFHADVNHFMDVGHIIDHTAGFILGFIPLMSRLNKTVFDVVPTGPTLDRHLTCIDNVVSIGDNAKLVRSDLRSLDQVVRGLPDMSGLNRTLGDLDASVYALPDLNRLALRIAFLNASIGAMPPLAPISDDLTSMNATMQSLKTTVGPVNTQIKGLKTTLSTFTTAPLTAKLHGFDDFWGQLPDLNLLKSDVNVTDNAPFRNINETYGNLVQMQRAVNGIPSIGGFIADLRQLNATKNQLSQSLVLIGLIRSLNASLHAIPDLNRIMASMKSFKKFLTTDYQLDVIKANVRSANRSIAMQPSPLKLLKYMTDMKASVTQIKAVDFAGMIGTIQHFNRTIGNLNCVSSLMDMIVQINSSLVVLPPEMSKVTDMWHDIQPQIANISKQQDSLQSGVDSIKKMNSSLDHLPDFDGIITKIKQMNASSGSLPNLSKVYDQITDLNKTLHDVPDMDAYINNTAKLNSSLKVANLDSTVNSLQDMKSQLNSMPDLQPHIDNMHKLNDTLGVLEPALSGVLTALQSRPTHAPPGYSLVASGLVSGIDQLQTTNSSRPDNSALFRNMNDLNQTVSTMPDLSSTQDSLVTLNQSLASFPDVGSLKAKIASLQNSLDKQPDFNALIRQLRDLNQTVLALPDLPATQAQVLDVKKSADSANINGTVDQLGQVADLNVDKSATDQLGQIKNLTAQLNMTQYFQMVQSTADSVTAYHGTVNDTRASVLATTDKFVDQFSALDSLRILGMVAVLLIPVVLAVVLGLSSVVCRCGCGSMCLALIFMYLSLLYYLLAALTSVPAVLVSDFCGAADDIAVNAGQISGASVLARNLTGLVPDKYVASNHRAALGEPMSVYVDYYWTCPQGGHVPLLIQDLPDIALDSLHSQANVTSLVAQAESSAKVKFVPNIHSQIDDVITHVDSIRDVVVDVQEFLLCGNITPYLHATIDIVCVDVRNSLVIWSFSLFLLALLMSVGVCCGVLGFKRLQRQNRVQDQGLEDDDDENDGAVPDLEAARAGTTPLGVPAISMTGQVGGGFKRTLSLQSGGGTGAGSTTSSSLNQK